MELKGYSCYLHHILVMKETPGSRISRLFLVLPEEMHELRLRGEYVACVCLVFFFENNLICTIFLDSTYKWYLYDIHFSLSDLLWQSLGLSTSLKMALFHSFLWFNNIPLYTCATSFFFHSSVDGHSDLNVYFPDD